MKKRTTLLFVLIISVITVKNAMGQNNQWSATNKFRNCISSMQSTNDELTRLNYAMNFFLTEHSTTIQLKDALHFLSNDQKRYELGVAAYPNILDKDNFFNVYDSFSKLSWAIKLYHNTQEKQQFNVLENDYQLNVVEDNQAIYDLLIEKGDLLLSENKFDESLLIYQQILEIKPSDALVMEKINNVASIQLEIALILEAENQINAQFNSFIQQGDILLSNNNVVESIEMYEQAMALKPGDNNAYLRIKEANHWKMELTNQVEEENHKRSQYEFLMQKGEILISSNSLDEAIAVFQEASAIFPREQLPFMKIEEVKHLQEEIIPSDYTCMTSESEFKNIKTSIDDQNFADDQMEMAKKHVKRECLSIEQMKEIVKIFSMDDDKLEMIQFLYDYSDQQDRFYEFRGLLTFNSSQKELDEFLVDQN